MRKLTLIVLAFVLIAGACSSTSTDDLVIPDDLPRDEDGNVVLGDDDIRLLSRLVPFDGCGDLLDHLQAEARERVGPYGLDYYGYGNWRFEGDIALDVEESMDDEAASFDAVGGDADSSASFDTAGTAASPAAEADGGGGRDFTGTNTQELGVDEPDIIKTDGDRILVANEGVLTYVDVSSGEPVKTDTLRIPEGWGHELFFQGDRALLFTNGGSWGYPVPLEPLSEPAILFEDDGDAEAEFAPPADDAIEPFEEPFYEEQGYYGPSAVIVEIDLSDPSDLEIAGTLSIQGQYLSARSVGDTVRLALTSGPNQLPWVFPSNPNGEDRAEEFNRELIDETTIEDWIPEYELTADGVTTGGPLLDCNRLHRPATFSGFDVVSVLSFDLDDGLNPGDGVGVLASGQTIYSSMDRFYVATTEWVGPEIWDDAARIDEWTEEYSTDVHAFSIDIDEPADYVASGSVAGTLLNQFSLDEHEGYLRVVTTEGSPWDRTNESESQLVVLEESGDILRPVGQVGGLGKGESVFSSRLIGDRGFIVTFRQVDPLYLLDLSDPTNPTVTGELKIPGVSTYLHPVGQNFLLGVGQDATEEGFQTGLKLSLFDVSDASDPREVSVWTMENANSPAEWDHRAFQIHNGVAIVPVQSWDGEFNGAMLFDVSDGTITEVGSVTHVPDSGEPSSDCREITADGLSEDTELYYIALEGRVQVCDDDDVGGYGGWYCETIQSEELQYWFSSSAEAEETLDDLGVGRDDYIQFCWPDGGNWDLQIQRSLVIDETLWTMSWSQLQANELDDLDDITKTIPLR